jgi:DNA-binding transcriptional MerR regulator
MAAALRRKDHFDEMLGALNPNIELPTRISSQIVDSQYFTRFLGAELAEGHASRTAVEDQARAVRATAAESGAPLQELRAIVEALNQRPPPDPFEGQAAHEARAHQAEVSARLATHQRGLAEVHRLAFTTRQAAAGLEEAQRTGFQTLARIAEQHGAALGAQGEATAGLREQMRKQGRRYAANFRARASSSSASEPQSEPGERGRRRV